MIKFGDDVIVLKEGFYKGAKGKVINYSQADQTYLVQLPHNICKDFIAGSLQLTKKRRKK